ncbi:MAG TPA: hypothetical protein VF713_06280 [Thermoanaerobaculia bacterium]
MKLSVSDDGLSATFSCEFCGMDHEWPFAARILWKGESGQQSYPEIRHVVTGHFWGDSNLSKFGFPACSQSHKWHDTDWECEDADSGKIIGTGRMTMKGGWPQIV